MSTIVESFSGSSWPHRGRARSAAAADCEKRILGRVFVAEFVIIDIGSSHWTHGSFGSVMKTKHDANSRTERVRARSGDAGQHCDCGAQLAGEHSGFIAQRLLR